MDTEVEMKQVAAELREDGAPVAAAAGPSGAAAVGKEVELVRLPPVID